MVLRMKNVNIFEVHWKIWHLGGGLGKPIYRGDCLQRGGGLGQFVVLRGAWQERGGGILRWVDILMPTICTVPWSGIIFTIISKFW